MRNKILLNALFTLCIFACLILAWTGFNDKHYEYMAAGIVGVILFAVLKARLIKDVRNTLKP
jgi:di/tricarboxylate transporter